MSANKFGMGYIVFSKILPYCYNKLSSPGITTVVLQYTPENLMGRIVRGLLFYFQKRLMNLRSISPVVFLKY